MGNKIVPEGWELSQLSNVCKIRKFNKNNSDLYIGLEHLGQGNNKLIGRDNINNFSSTKNAFRKNDILYGKLRPVLNKTWLATEDGFCSTDILPIQTNEKIIPIILLHIISSLKFVNYSVSSSSGTKMPRTKWEEMGNFPFLIPINMKEQELIAQIIIDINNVINNLEKLFKKKKNIQEGVKQNLLTGRKRLSSFNEDWKTTSLRNCVVMNTSTSKTELIEDNGKYIIMDMGSVSSEGKNISQKYTNYEGDFLQFGDLVMPKDDIGGGHIIGKTVFIDKNNKYVLGDHVYVLSTKNSNENSLFLSYLINSHQINSKIHKIVTGSAQLGIRKTNVGEIELTIPKDPKEQKEIAEVLLDMDLELDEINLKREKYQMIKEGITQKILIGEIRIK